MELICLLKTFASEDLDAFEEDNNFLGNKQEKRSENLHNNANNFQGERK